MLYVITDGNFCKIGIAKNPKYRMKNLQTGNPNKLRIAKVWSDGNWSERYIHDELKGYLAPANNEWFCIDPKKCIKFIDQYLIENEPKKRKKYLRNSTTTVIDINALSKLPNFASTYRDKVFIELLIHYGLSIGEIVKIKWCDLQDDKLILFGKNKKTRIIRLSPMMKQSIYQLEPLGNEYIFTTNRGSNMTSTNAHIMLKKVAKRAGIDENITVSNIRHSYAVSILQNGGTLKDVQLQLGVTLTSVQRYLGEYANLTAPNKN